MKRTNCLAENLTYLTVATVLAICGAVLMNGMPVLACAALMNAVYAAKQIN